MKHTLDRTASFAVVLLVLASGSTAPAQTRSLDELKRAGAMNSTYHKASLEASESRAPEANLEAYRETIAPILLRSCGSCHGADEQEANFRVDTLDPDLIHGQDASWWLEVMQVLSNAEMPPADSEIELTDQQRAAVIDWLAAELQVASQVARSEQGHSSFRRLTRYEYNYALQDLLGLPYDFAKDLPPETPSEDGFQNSSEMLHLTASQLATYRDLGRRALQKATVRGAAPDSIHYSITMDEAAGLMISRNYRRQIERIEKDEKDPVKREKKLAELRGKAKSFNRNSPHFINVKTDIGVQGRYSYGGARYSWTPSSTPPSAPTSHDDRFVLPAGGRQIFDLGDHLPDTGWMRIRLRACRTSDQGDSFPPLRISFGFQASNNSQAAFRVGDDLTINAAPDKWTFYEFDIPLGEVSRNPYRGNMELGKTPNPSEYLVLQNLHSNKNLGTIQIDYIEVTAPFIRQWPPESHRQIFFENHHGDDESAYATDVLSRFMRRAWRRDATDQEIEQKLSLFRKLRPSCEDFNEAMIEVLATVISSPKFLYLTASHSEGGTLSDTDLATRLAVFLWSSSPDEELLALADAGRLNDIEELARQTDRMLADPRAERFSRHFTRQWLGLQLLDYLKVDRKQFPYFDEELKEAMLEEPIALFHHMVDQNQSVMDFLHADYTMANERLSKHYGIPDVHGTEFRRVNFPEGYARGGLLTQAGLLAMNSDGKDSHPLKRGIWLLENLLHDPPPPPPPAVPEIDLSDPDILKLTLKQRMEDHRNDPACRSCHARIDPWGVALENFDAAGAWRDEVGGQPVDATSELFNGQSLNGVDGLKRFLLEHRQDQFASALTHKMITYALGRPLAFADRAGVEQIAGQLRRDGDGLQTLIHLIVTNELFRSH